MLDIYTVFTARDLRDALSQVRNLITLVDEKFSKDYKGFKYQKDALEKRLKKIKEENVRDKLEYLYRFITNLAWLSMEVTKHDKGFLDKTGFWATEEQTNDKTKT